MTEMGFDGDRYVATQHWQHSDWTVYDQEQDRYRLRGLTEIEALEYADCFNAELKATYTPKDADGYF